MIKLFVSDIDGTFLNDHHKLTNFTKDAVKKLLDSGVKLMLASGRDYKGMKKITDDLGKNLELISLNGADFRDLDGNSLLNFPLSKESLTEIIKYLKEHDNAVEIYTNKNNYSNLQNDKINDVYIENIHKSFGTDKDEIRKFIEALEFSEKYKYLENFDDILNEDVLKVEFHVDCLDKKAIFMDKLSKIPNVVVTTSFSTNIEITDTKATKGNMVLEVLKKYGIEKDEVLVIGDSPNDASMLKLFKNSYAMENGFDEVKKCANFVCESNANDGCAKVMLKVIEENNK